MRPRETVYRKIQDADRHQVDKLWSTTDIPKFPTSFPEIVAERDGEIIGFVARRYHDDERILIEPMIAPNFFIYRRLWFRLEKELKTMGIRKYFFRVEPHRIVYEHALWGAEARGIIRSIGYFDGYNWFERVAA